MNSTVLQWVRLGRMAYDKALEVQEAQRDRLLDGTSHDQVVYTVEHPPTITIGRSGSREHVLASSDELERMGMQVYHVDRGGDVTYHGPGQLVVYPVLHLSPWGNDVGKYVRMLEETVIQALGEAGIVATRQEGYPGVWVGNEKICAVGVRMRRRADQEFVTSHGIALNLNTNLVHFETIVPCGLADKGVTSVARQTGALVDFAEWEARLVKYLSEVFSAEIVRVEPKVAGL